MNRVASTVEPAVLALELADELGALALRDLLLLAAFVARGREFSAQELIAHALLVENLPLRDAILASCGEVSARRLGQLLSKWKTVDLCGLRVDAIGEQADGILWKLSRPQPTPDPTTAASRATMAVLPTR